jgi:hypothetical protein
MVLKIDYERAGLKRPVNDFAWLISQAEAAEARVQSLSAASATPRTPDHTTQPPPPTLPIQTSRAGLTSDATSPHRIQQAPLGSRTQKSSESADTLAATTAPLQRLQPNVREAALKGLARVIQSPSRPSARNASTSRALVLWKPRRRRTQAEILRDDWQSLPYFKNMSRRPMILEYGSMKNTQNLRRSQRVASRQLLTAG